MNCKASAIYEETVLEFAKIYGKREASVLTDILFDELLGIQKIDRLTQPDLILKSDHLTKFREAEKRMLQQEPIQHILGQAHFYKRVFKVSKHTLIPRPETEELVDLIVKENPQSALNILDVGTGTGCIPISLALEMKNVSVKSVDISEKALAIANENAKEQNASVEFKLLDILEDDIPWMGLDIIVSNPPYIPGLEKGAMHVNVTDYEPGLALFVPDDDPLVFYRNIAKKGMKSLKPEGKIYFEIHENFGKDTSSLLSEIGYAHVLIHKDLQGKDRIIVAQK